MREMELTDEERRQLLELIYLSEASSVSERIALKIADSIKGRTQRNWGYSKLIQIMLKAKNVTNAKKIIEKLEPSSYLKADALIRVAVEVPDRECLSHLEEAKSLASVLSDMDDRAAVFNSLSRAFAARGHWTEAIAAASKIEIGGDSIDAMREIAYRMEEAGNTQAARNLAQAAAARANREEYENKAWILSDLAKLMYDLRSYDEAGRLIELAIPATELEIDRDETLVHIVSVLLAMNLCTRAEHVASSIRIPGRRSQALALIAGRQ